MDSKQEDLKKAAEKSKHSILLAYAMELKKATLKVNIRDNPALSQELATLFSRLTQYIKDAEKKPVCVDINESYIDSVGLKAVDTYLHSFSWSMEMRNLISDTTRNTIDTAPVYEVGAGKTNWLLSVIKAQFASNKSPDEQFQRIQEEIFKFYQSNKLNPAVMLKITHWMNEKLPDSHNNDLNKNVVLKATHAVIGIEPGKKVADMKKDFNDLRKQDDSLDMGWTKM